jgi:two-component system cell cycle response regulator CpdR
VSPARSATILVVDDEEGVRTLLRHQITALGHTVQEAGNGLEALHLVRLQPERYDLVLSDVVMPLMNGIELASLLMDEQPGLPVVLISAYAPNALTRVGIHQAVIPVLMKPFDIEELHELIQLALERPAEPRRPPLALAD